MLILASALIFPFALVLALCTIAMMLGAYGGKMIAALRMEDVPAAYGNGSVPAVPRGRSARSANPRRSAPYMAGHRFVRAA